MLEKLAELLKAQFQSLREKIDKDGQKLINKPLDATHVDRREDYMAIAYGKHYVKLWLAEMYLRKQVQLGQEFYPAVHSLVRFSFGTERVEVPCVADASRLGMQQDKTSGDVIARNFELTPYVPFNSGTIELNAGLIAVQGQDFVGNFISTLSDFASLLAVPQFSAALSVAQPLAKGLQTLLGSGSGRLALHDTFAKGQQGGYFVAIRGTEEQIDTHKLWVIKDQLRYGTGPSEAATAPFTKFDYMLFRIEVTEALPEEAWKHLPSINEPMSKIEEAYIKGDTDEAESLFRTAVVAVRRAKELTTAQRILAQQALKADYEGLTEI